MRPVLDALDLCLERGLTFAAFRASDGHLHLWVQERPVLEQLPIEDLDDQGTCFVMAPFPDGGQRVHVLRPGLMLRPDDDPLGPGTMDHCQGNTAFHGDPGPAWDEGGHAQAITMAKQAFAKGGLRKVVLARQFPEALGHHMLPHLFLAGLETLPTAFVCLVNSPEFGTWLGASPERLLSADADHVTVDAIAGTMPVADAPDEAARWGAKERDEQEQVTLAVREAFDQAGLTERTEEGPEVLYSGPVAHLHTRVRSPLYGQKLAPLITALHPTPAVCGSPRETARVFISRHEPHERGLYTGFWGPWRQKGRTDLFVNIRCLRAFRNEVRIHVGGGITAGSEAQAEWRETEHKAQVWLGAIATLKARIS